MDPREAPVSGPQTRGENRGALIRQTVPTPAFPNTDDLLQDELAKRPRGAVDILLVNPPAPDGGIWIRSQHRVGRRSREGMIWPQVELAQMAALFPDYRVDVIDAIPSHMTWQAFEALLDEKRPRYYITQVTAPTLQNDMVGVFLAKARGAVTMAFGTHVTPMPRSTMEAYPALDYVLLGEPELTLREVVDTLEAGGRTAEIESRKSEVESRKSEVESPKSEVESRESEVEGRESGGEGGVTDVEGMVAAGHGPQSPALSPCPHTWWPNVEPAFADRLYRLFTKTDPGWRPVWMGGGGEGGESPKSEVRSPKSKVESHKSEALPFAASSIEPPVSSIEHPASSIEPPLSSIQPPASSFQLPAPSPQPPAASPQHPVSSIQYPVSTIRGLVWRSGGAIITNPARPFIADLNDLPLPRHEMLPVKHYRAPLVGGPYAFVVPSRGCPAACRFCIKHVSYGRSVRYRDPENVLDEMEHLVSLGVRKIHMYADLFTVNRDHVMGICQGILDRKLDVRWTCNSRVDFVDPEMLRAMRAAGCWMISWGIESADEEMLKRMHKGITPAKVEQALTWAKEAGIMNWGYFIIGLPGETEASIRASIDFAKRLPLDLVLFHIAAPHPGTPFFFEVVENGWFRPGTRWEEVDMDRSTVLDYPNLKAEELERWAQRAFREWAFRPGPMRTYLKLVLADPGVIKSALRIGLETLGWK